MWRPAAQILFGLGTYVPGLRRWLARGTGGTDTALYCYSVWLRHLVMAAESRLVASAPESVAELGPGDSLGIGLAALLSGTHTYFALDALPHAGGERNLEIFDELVELFQKRAEIPGDALLPEVKPKLASYAFPHHLLTRERLAAALDRERLAGLRRDLRNPDGEDSAIRYFAPWDDPRVLEPGSVDMVLSQAVLEHVEQPASVYRAMARWLRPGGFVSHQIDFKCHGTAAEWNGHWTYSDLVWRLIRGRRPYLLNRLPCSAHLRLLEEAGLQPIRELRVRTPSRLPRHRLARPFRGLEEDDLETSGLFVQAASGERAA